MEGGAEVVEDLYDFGQGGGLVGWDLWLVGNPGLRSETWGTRVGGVDEESGAAGYVGFEEADAFVGGVPGADDDVVEFVAEELVDGLGVGFVDFEEVGQGAEGLRGGAGLLGAFAAGGEELFDGVGE